MSFPYSYSILGLVPGLILTVVQAAFVLYTSLIVWYDRTALFHSFIDLTHVGSSASGTQRPVMSVILARCCSGIRKQHGT